MVYLISQERLSHIIQKELKGANAVDLNWFIDKTDMELNIFVNNQYGSVFLFSEPFRGWEFVHPQIFSVLSSSNEINGLKEVVNKKPFQSMFNESLQGGNS